MLISHQISLISRHVGDGKTDSGTGTYRSHKLCHLLAYPHHRPCWHVCIIGPTLYIAQIALCWYITSSSLLFGISASSFPVRISHHRQYMCLVYIISQSLFSYFERHLDRRSIYTTYILKASFIAYDHMSPIPFYHRHLPLDDIQSSLCSRGDRLLCLPSRSSVVRESYSDRKRSIPSTRSLQVERMLESSPSCESWYQEACIK